MKDSAAMNPEGKLRALVLFLFFLVVFFSFVYPIKDPDLPWHLLTGHYILANRTIPMSFDPFSFATEKIPFVGQFILSQNWLAQILLYIIYGALGPLGLVLTRALVFTLIIAIIWYLVNLKKGAFIAVLSGGSVAFLTHKIFSGIRPQIFTFLFTAVVILLMEKYRDTRSVKWLYPLPILMLVWANMHGGFIYGVVLILIYLIGDTAESLLRGKLASPEADRLTAGQLRRLITFGLLSILFSLINPNTYKAFVYTFMTHWPNYKLHELYSQIILENKTPFTLMGINSSLFYYFLILLTFALVIAVVFIIYRQPVRLLLVLFAVMPALVAIRYIPLFVIVAVPLVAYMPEAAAWRLPPSRKIGLWVALIFFFSFVAIFSNPFRNRNILRINGSSFYPLRAANFLLKNNIKGNIFASYNTAAFILFKCYPGSRTYIDSRFVDVTRMTRGLAIEGAFQPMAKTMANISKLVPAGVGRVRVSGQLQREGRISLNNMLDKIGADIIVHEAVNHYSETISPFIFKLVSDNTWKLIYVDGTVMIFVRDEPRFRNIISRYQMPKSRIYDEIVAECLRTGRQGKHYYSSIALALLLDGIADEHTSFYIERALSRDPKDPIANYSKVLFTLMKRAEKKGMLPRNG